MMNEATQKFYRFLICFLESKKSTPYFRRKLMRKQMEAMIVSGKGAIAMIKSFV